MTEYIGRNRRYFIGSRVGSGAEGVVYKVGGGDVAKILNPSSDLNIKEKKILKMLRIDLPSGLDHIVAWPSDILYDLDGAFAGYTMRRIDSAYSQSTLTEWPRSDNSPFRDGYATFWMLAMNLASVVARIHGIGLVIGDMNEENISFASNGAPILYDGDSFHLSDGLPCIKARPEFLPYFMYDALDAGLDNWKGRTFTESTDSWALAVHIFMLLCNGCHPFACIRSKNCTERIPNIAENIRSRSSPFFVAMSGFRPPLYAPSLDILPPEVLSLFHRAFTGEEKDIPSASEWEMVLRNVVDEGFERGPCNVSHHKFPRSVAHQLGGVCPLCKARRLYDANDLADTSYMRYTSATAWRNPGIPTASAISQALGRLMPASVSRTATDNVSGYGNGPFGAVTAFKNTIKKSRCGRKGISRKWL